MFRRIRIILIAALPMVALAVITAPIAQADVPSLVSGSCGTQPESQAFAQFGDFNEYTPVSGGSFEAGSAPWQLSGDAAVATGNETFFVNSSSDSQSLSLPTGSSTLSPSDCTDIDQPTLRLFVRNTGAASSRLTVQAVYPIGLGQLATTTIGVLSGTSSWEPSPALSIETADLIATLSLSDTTIAFRFTPSGSGAWSIDDVEIDPYGRG